MIQPDIKVLYKYRRMSDHALDIFRKRELWFSKPNELNDPFDCDFEPTLDFGSSQEMWNALHKAGRRRGLKAGQIKQALKKLDDPTFQQRQFDNPRIQEMLKYVRDTHNEIGVCSFSTDPANIPMWSHYADSHKGFCVRFHRRPTNWLGSDPQTRPVVYTPDFRVIPVNTKNSKLVVEALWQKSPEWSYEQEWRTLLAPGNKAYGITDEMIAGFIFGCRTPALDEQKLREVTSHLPGVTYERIVKTKGKYSIQIEVA